MARATNTAEGAERRLTVPNLLTGLRLLLVPVFLIAFLGGHAAWALATFIVAELTDGLDGVLARLLNQSTRLGALLDPAADKLLSLTALGALGFSGGLPLWLLLLAFARDGALAVGALIIHVRGLPMPAEPSRIGKYATFSLAVTVVLALVRRLPYADQELLAVWVAAAGLVAAECVAVSAVQYVGRAVTWFKRVASP